MTTRRLNFQPLLIPGHLTCDTQDGIESAVLTHATMEDAAGLGRMYIDVSRHSEFIDLHAYIRRYFGKDNPLSSGWFRLTQARIVMHMRAARRPLAMNLSLPHTCHMTAEPMVDEYTLGEHYLRRWGLLDDDK